MNGRKLKNPEHQLALMWVFIFIFLTGTMVVVTFYFFNAVFKAMF